MTKDSKDRFSSRADDYVRYRPGYPPAILDVLRKECALLTESVVADIGSGTGILTELLLASGHRVYGVEPNAAMREAGEEFLQNHPRFDSVAGSAEATTLETASIDLIVAGQAFHWFEPVAARREFARILAPQGRVALIWNERDVQSSAFMRAYERLLGRHGTDYSKVQHVYSEQARLDGFFSPGELHSREFANTQVVSLDGLRGRLMSASYAPQPGEPGYLPMIEDLGALFEAHQEMDRVAIRYRTRIYWGTLGRANPRRFTTTG
jgi:SAM-dependent methyltransferase